MDEDRSAGSIARQEYLFFIYPLIGIRLAYTDEED
jgi:hypothetical protein